MEPGDTFDRYVIEAQIGAGGMGEVYRAYDPKLHRRVALKVLLLEGSGRDEQAERILREARAAAALDHPNAVHIYDVGAHDGRPYLAMELVEGKSLRTAVGDASITIELKIRWICDIGRALAAAHRRGLVHRDVKPDNVMVRDDGSIKVLDFGIARRAQAPIDPNAPTAVAGAVETLTGDGVVVGTPMYMSPEQMRGEPVDHRTDQFAWAVLAFELLVGRLPWGPRTDGVRLVAAMLSQDAPHLRSTDATIAPNVDAAIARALSRKRDERFATMSDAIAALEGATSGAQARSTVPGSSRTRRLAGWPLVAGVVLAGLVGGGVALKNVRWSKTTTGPSQSASTSASTHGVALTDLPTPTTQFPQAATAYREGLQALRDGSWDIARHSFQRATEIDPSMAAAHLRLAITIFGTGSDARSAWQRAQLLRNALDERGRMLFDAYDFVIRQEIPDYLQQKRVLGEMVARWPNDAELFELLGDADRRLFQDEAAVRDYDRAIELDPLYADPATVKPSALLDLGRFEDAIDAAKDCEKRFPTSLDCVQGLVWAYRWLGPCDAMEAATRRALEHDDKSVEAWVSRAQALYALGRPLEAVGTALDHAAALLPESERESRRLEWQLGIDVLQGRFDVVEKDATALEGATSSDAHETPHGDAARARIAAFLEEGRLADAAVVADDYLKHVDGWTPAQRGTFFYDMRFVATHVLVMAGKIDAKTFDLARSGFLYRLATRTPPAPPSSRWLAAWAVVAEDPDEARRAVGALGDLGPVSPFVAVYAPSVGRTFSLAGRPDDALPQLDRAVNACFSFDAPREVRRASYFLGLTYESKGDVAAACRSYADLLAHWGNAKPKSVTADLARARVTALKCAPP